MRNYLFNSKPVTKSEWAELFKKYPEATVILRTNKLPDRFTKEETNDIISAEKARLIRDHGKNQNKQTAD